MTSQHALHRVDFEELGRGHGSVDTVTVLREWQLSKRKLAFSRLVSAVVERSLDEGLPTKWESLFDLLSSIEAHSPDSVNNILLQPAVGSWIQYCSRHLDQPDQVDLAYLGNVVSAVALRAGTACGDINVATHEGAVFLPSLGSACVHTGRSLFGIAILNSIVMTIDCDGIVIALPESVDVDQEAWLALRRVTVESDGLALDISLDYLDPYRKRHGLDVVELLDVEEFARWQRLTADGWEILVGHHRHHAQAMAAGLQSIVPLWSNDPMQGLSATANDALGCVFMTEPGDGLGMALSLVHEFQHNKYGMLTEFVSLHRTDERSLHYAPWRGDPRPIGGLLNGAYAHLGIVEFWAKQRQVVDGARRRAADVEFARWRGQVARAIRSIEASGLLNEEGVRFVNAMSSSLAPMLREPVAGDCVRLARDMAIDHEVSWRLRNLRPHDECMEILAVFWITGTSPRKTCFDSTIETRSRLVELSPRQILMNSVLASGMMESHAKTHEEDSADAGLIAGDYEKALRGYEDQIMEGDNGVNVWAGFTVAMLGCTRAVVQYPEVLRAMFEKLNERDGIQAKPTDLAEWVDAMSVPEHATGEDTSPLSASLR